MTDRLEIRIGDCVEKTGGDYKFYGFVVSVFRKMEWDENREPVLTGPVRIVAQNNDGMLHIFNLSQVERVK
jgi:hypothetical protein